MTDATLLAHNSPRVTSTQPSSAVYSRFPAKWDAAAARIAATRRWPTVCTAIPITARDSSSRLHIRRAEASRKRIQCSVAVWCAHNCTASSIATRWARERGWRCQSTLHGMYQAESRRTRHASASDAQSAVARRSASRRDWCATHRARSSSGAACRQCANGAESRKDRLASQRSRLTLDSSMRAAAAPRQVRSPEMRRTWRQWRATDRSSRLLMSTRCFHGSSARCSEMRRDARTALKQAASLCRSAAIRSRQPTKDHHLRRRWPREVAKACCDAAAHTKAWKASDEARVRAAWCAVSTP
eukprot:scaffold14900_cov103-Isochrysis_galbana.AAC.4